MSLRDIWNWLKAAVSDLWYWLINADLIEGAKILGVIALAVVGVTVAYTIFGTISMIYTKGLLYLYEKYPVAMRRSYWAALLAFVFSSGFLVLSVIGAWAGFAIPDQILLALILFAVASLLASMCLRKPEENA